MEWRKPASWILAILVTLFLIKVFDLSYPLTIRTSQSSSELAVTGEGKVDVVPDTAYVDVGISVRESESVNEAQTQINSINNRIIVALGRLGIKKEDIKTSNYSIFPNVVFRGEQEQSSGFNGSVSVNVKLRDTQLVAQVIEAATEAGANEVYGTRFEVDNPAKFREEARNKAIENAREQAQKLARSLGIRLGKVVNIVEASQGSSPIPIYDRALETTPMGGAEGPDIQPGSQTINSVVTLYFEKR